EASVVNQVNVSEKYTFGLTGGAGGVLNVCGLIGIRVDRDSVWLAQEAFPLYGIEINNVLKGQRLSRAGFFEDRFVFRVATLIVEKKGAHAGLTQHEGKHVSAIFM